MEWSLDRDLASIRKEFPILDRCVYLISNSLGAAPREALEALNQFYQLWAEEGVVAWEKKWWELARKVGNEISSFLGAGEDEVTMIPNATQAHWVVLSTKFIPEDRRRNKIIMTSLDFPSEIYAITEIAKFMGWELEMVKSQGQPGVEVDEILDKIDEKTLFVATSHVCYKSAYIQDIATISARAQQLGVLTLIDGYHGPGILPVDVKKLDVDFYVGGCLKWLCGGPGNAFLYTRPELASSLHPQLTGWLAHQNPFLFAPKMEYAKGSYRFMAGTPPIPSHYTALPGLNIIKKIGISQIRNKSLRQTALIIRNVKERGFRLFTPEEDDLRGGAISIGLPHTFSVKQALVKRGVKVDFRKGLEEEPDVIRVAPHFYTKDEEIEALFGEIDSILQKGEFERYSSRIKDVT
jgi:kynureninase